MTKKSNNVIGVIFMSEIILSNELIRSFAAHLRAEEKSEITIQKYLRDVKMPSHFLPAADRSQKTSLWITKPTS